MEEEVGENYEELVARVGSHFMELLANCWHDGFWWFQAGEHPTAVYVCEAAIDAMPYLFMKPIEKKKSKNRLFMCQSAA